MAGDGAGSDRGAPVPLHLQHVCGFIVAPFWQGRQPWVWFSETIVGFPSIAAFTFLRTRNSTLCIINKGGSVHGICIRCFVSSIATCKNSPLASLAIFNARHVSDSSAFTPPPFLAISTDMCNTYQKFVVASSSESRLSCLLYITT